METVQITESVCPRCTESGQDRRYIERENHCKHVTPRGENDYVWYKDSIEEDEE